MNKKMIFIGFSIALVVFVFLNRKQKKSTVTPRESASEKSVSITGSSPDKRSFASSQARKGSSAGNSSAPVAPSVGAGYFRDANGRRFVNVNLVPRRQCMQGDADAMIALKKKSGAKLILAMEPVDSEDAGKAASKEISENDLLQGVDIAFEIKQDSPKVYGIFVCSDVKGAKSCQGKPAADIVFGFDSFISSLESTRNSDMVFFAHLLILDKQNYQVYQSDFSLQNVSNTFAAALGKPQLDANERSKARYFADLLENLRPYPLVPLYDGGPGTSLKMQFTLGDPTFCRD
jgi:hypothetical protein